MKYSIMIKDSQNSFKFLIISLQILLVLLLGSKAGAQSNSSSPYTRFGIGDLQSPVFAETDGMGTSNLAVHDPFNINFSNPASYSSLRFTTFEFGAVSNFTKFGENGYPSNTTNNTNIAYLALGLPVVANIWGASIGLLPYSNVGYKISDVGTTPAGDAANYLYTGSGGINQIYFGNSLNLFKHLSLGANVSYLFGSMVKQNQVNFPGLASSLGLRSTVTTHINDLTYRFGMIYTLDSIKVDSARLYGPKNKLSVVENTEEKLVVANAKDTLTILKKPLQLKKSEVISNTYEGIAFTRDKDTLFINNATGKLRVDSIRKAVKKVKIKSDRSLSFGLTYSLSAPIVVKNDSLDERYTSDAFGSVIVHDTANFSVGSQGKIILPLSLGFGISYKQGTRLLLSAEAAIQDWSKFSAFGQNDQLSNSMKVAAGAQIGPDYMLAKTFFKSITYRFGAYYTKTYIDLKSTQLDDFGVTIGMGLPVFRSLSKINISLIAGQRGTLTNGLVREQYFRISLGFSLADKWFNKYKYE